ncbi:hypothetical protein Ade02nite_24780 [Paractinoplanes deccanensis]|uniref:Uncharacterized protein n=1 Tax=Paractinoplanes deccanensis TaxID=113561 RepID=A0ABQ3Y1J2_9ACTN|nr:hypothetical protein [Actinoplanes deccanensis]GID73837.1 hypothetical protein Ade02nite_24780 [Actinoplanes deccanensis]
MRRPIYPASRAIEHAATLPGVRPLRLFPMLWPLWQVEVSADVHDKQSFELIDHFIVRAIEEGAVRAPAGLAAFLGLPLPLVERCLAFLGTIEHVTTGPAGLELTPLGMRSVRENVRYVPSTSRLTLLVDRHTGRPFPRPYYDRNVPILDTPEIDDGRPADRTGFARLFTAAPYNPEVVTWLENRPDRADYNLPGEFGNLRQLGHRPGYLPSYLIETAGHGLLAYTAVGERRDEFLEQVCAETAAGHRIEATGLRDPEQIWRGWLARSKWYGAGELENDDGLWRVVLGGPAFGEHPLIPYTRIGTYQLHDHHFLRIWCDDEAARRRALLDRALGIATLPEVAGLDDLHARCRDLAASLQVPEVSIAGLRRHARATGDPRHAARLDELTRGDER